MAKEGILNEQSAGGWRRVEHKAAGFSISIPPDWRVGPNVMGAAVAAVAPHGSDYAANLNVVRYDLDDGSTVDAFIEDHLASLRMFLTDLLLIDREAIELDDRPGFRLLFHYRQGIFEVTLTQWLAEVRGRVFLLSTACTSSDFDEVSQAFAGIAASFTVT